MARPEIELKDPSRCNHRARVRDETRHISDARGARRAWWEGFLGSYYEIARPLGLRPTASSIFSRA